MADPTQLVRDDVYEDMASSYQCLLVSILDGVLQEHGIVEAEVRRKICEGFLFTAGDLHDEGWFKPFPDGERVYPLLCFSKRFLNVDTSIDELGVVHAPSTSFAFHEYAFGNAALLYEGDPNARVETGCVGDE